MPSESSWPVLGWTIYQGIAARVRSTWMLRRSLVERLQEWVCVGQVLNLQVRMNETNTFHTPFDIIWILSASCVIRMLTLHFSSTCAGSSASQSFQTTIHWHGNRSSPPLETLYSVCATTWPSPSTHHRWLKTNYVPHLPAIHTRPFSSFRGMGRELYKKCSYSMELWPLVQRIKWVQQQQCLFPCPTQPIPPLSLLALHQRALRAFQS